MSENRKNDPALEDLDLTLSKTRPAEEGEAPRILASGKNAAANSACGLRASYCGELVKLI